MSAAEINAAQLSGTLGAASLSGALSTGAVVLNDYAIAIAPIDGGHRLTVTRGSEVQTMDVLDGVDGVGIAGIEKTATIDNVDEYTITMTDGSNYTFTVTNGTGGSGGGSADVPIASETVAGIVRVGENLKISADGVLSVDTATAVEEDNTRPVTSAAVQTTVGNIEVLLKTI